MPRIIRDSRKPAETPQISGQVSGAQSSGLTTYEWASSKFDSMNCKLGQDSGLKTKGKKWRRKVDEGYNSEDEYSRPRISEVDDRSVQFVCFSTLENCLKEKLGYSIVRMGLDGNCLFRSVADQVYGDQELHDVVRMLCMEYMIKERQHFSQFITEDFDQYIERKRKDGIHGNHLELQAISEIYSSPVEIYAFDEKPLNIFQGSYGAGVSPIRLSYHYGVHYNSVVDPTKPREFRPCPSVSPNGDTIKQMLLESELASMGNLILERTKQESEITELEEKMVTEAIRENEATMTEDSILQQTMVEVEQQQLESDMLQQILKETELEAVEQQLMDYEMTGFEDGLSQAVEESELEQLQLILNQSILEASMMDF
eukprot:TRINITY_DN6180_c0_g1_i3.p1 TRINITY_DN6180_c0_g1~~TRINITY_DN6180_c0_g1_i3.p1  ORF type:complete len:371 (+),score=51.98 TRINITY_DN6180_c0_g1_i3:20-1132(+)